MRRSRRPSASARRTAEGSGPRVQSAAQKPLVCRTLDASRRDREPHLREAAAGSPADRRQGDADGRTCRLDRQRCWSAEANCCARQAAACVAMLRAAAVIIDRRRMRDRACIHGIARLRTDSR